MTMAYHEPVLLFESVDGLNVKPDGIYVDVTFGGGGHSREILKRLNEEGRLFAFDQDADAQQNVLEDERFTLVPQNFRYLGKFLRFYGIHQVDGILADLGVSSHQFDSDKRGFSIRFDSELDMRMDQAAEISALTVVNEYSEEQLASVLFQYGELRNSRALAREIVRVRKDRKIRTSFQLKDAIVKYLPRQKENKVLAQVFQAIRIEVNGEMEALKEFLQQTVEVMGPGGRLSVISYHSLEDRLVKRYINNGVFEGEPVKDFYGNVRKPFKRVGKLILPSDEEIARNNRARSARLRVAERMEEEGS
jgi:16S rRNA (cytosine1402-N4)-methyltransferase